MEENKEKVQDLQEEIEPIKKTEVEEKLKIKRNSKRNLNRNLRGKADQNNIRVEERISDIYDKIEKMDASARENVKSKKINTLHSPSMSDAVSSSASTQDPHLL